MVWTTHTQHKRKHKRIKVIQYALCIPTVHDFCIISVQLSACKYMNQGISLKLSSTAK